MPEEFAFYLKNNDFEIGFSNKYFDFEKFFSGKRFSILKQIHSDIVHRVETPFSDKEGDGLITDKKELYLVIKTADCYPVIFYNKKGGFIGAVHSGWRGTYKNIIKSFKEKALEYASLKTVLNDTEVIVGPGICGNCYEVKDDVVKLFKKAGFEDDFFKEEKRKIFLDVRKAINFTLAKEGFLPENIKNINLCTFEDSTLYSYRKDKTKIRLYNFIKKINNKKILD